MHISITNQANNKETSPFSPIFRQKGLFFSLMASDETNSRNHWRPTSFWLSSLFTDRHILHLTEKYKEWNSKCLMVCQHNNSSMEIIRMDMDSSKVLSGMEAHNTSEATAVMEDMEDMAVTVGMVGMAEATQACTRPCSTLNPIINFRSMVLFPHIAEDTETFMVCRSEAGVDSMPANSAGHLPHQAMVMGHR